MSMAVQTCNQRCHVFQLAMLLAVIGVSVVGLVLVHPNSLRDFQEDPATSAWACLFVLTAMLAVLFGCAVWNAIRRKKILFGVHMYLPYVVWFVFCIWGAVELMRIPVGHGAYAHVVPTAITCHCVLCAIVLVACADTCEDHE